MSLNFFQKETPANDGMKMVWGVILINAAIHLIFSGNRDFFSIFALHCQFGAFYPWQLLTGGFLHSSNSFFHLFFNMYSLYLFGSLVAPHIGKRNFLWLYLTGVLFGNLLFLIINWGTNNVVVGASGAVFAIMAAAAMLEPNRKFTLILMPFKPLSTSSMVLCFAIVEVLLELSGAQTDVAHLAHLGGLAGGYLFIKVFFSRMAAWDPFRRRVRNVPPPPPSASSGPKPSGKVSSAELDALLDKISRYGINSLSEYELERLRQAREEMRGR